MTYISHRQDLWVPFVLKYYYCRIKADTAIQRAIDKTTGRLYTYILVQQDKTTGRLYTYILVQQASNHHQWPSISVNLMQKTEQSSANWTEHAERQTQAQRWRRKKKERERNKLFIGGHIICYYGTTKWPSCPEGRPTYHHHTKTNKHTNRTNKENAHTQKQQQQQQLLDGGREAHLETEELQEKVSGGCIITYNHNLQHIITRVAQ